MSAMDALAKALHESERQLAAARAELEAAWVTIRRLEARHEQDTAWLQEQLALIALLEGGRCVA
ncbi:MAG: hypothetical protein Q4F67_12340 [Propionibacteriaceae bacterium]|nr:hypothetical protein [Propionibacteriaceae bacterium]